MNMDGMHREVGTRRELGTRHEVGVQHEVGVRSEIWQVGILLSLVLAIRLLLIATAPAGLSHDEAYYWEWSRNLDWGYYSKPPMIAWLIAASTSIGGATEFFVRLPAAVLSTLGLLMVYLLARSLFGRRVAWWACLLTAATPGSVALGFLMTIDAPLMCAWTATLYFFWRATQGESLQRGWLIASAIAMGLGLLAKQTMLAIYPLSFIYLLINARTRRYLWDGAYWAWGIGSFLFLTPVFWWNANHGWPTLRHTQEHFQEVPLGWTEHLKDAVEFWGTQFGVYSPITFTVVVVSLLCCVFRWKKLSQAETFLACFSLLPLTGILLLSFRQRLEPNWPAPFYVTAMILAAAMAVQRKLTWPGFRDRGLLPRALIGGALFAGVTFIAPYATQWAPLRGRKIDPLVRLHGWRELAAEVDKHRQVEPDGSKTPILVTAGRAETSELAFYLPDHPAVSLWRQGDSVSSQYDLWQRDYPASDQSMLILAPHQQPLPALLADRLQGPTAVDDIEIVIGNGRVLRFSMYRYEPIAVDNRESRLIAKERGDQASDERSNTSPHATR